jgi:murein DD-endopeptidase MepM/ murein hydrolase activator NlpD
MSVSNLKALLEKYYGQDATIIPGYDKDTGTWDGNYDTPDLSDNNYDGIYLNTSYSGDITKGYIYQKYSDMSLWDEMALDTDESKVIHVIQNIFLQGEKLYGDEKLHLSDFQFNGSDYDAPITTGDGDTISTGSPLSCYTAITSSFNNQESFRTATHKGLDIAAPAGTKIYSVVDGVVVASNSGCPAVGYYGNKCGGGYGNYVKVKASDGKFYIYAHMYQTPLVSTGDSVSKGQQLGIVGSSGSSTGNHLHFEVRNSGNTAINPIDYANTGSIPKC